MPELGVVVMKEKIMPASDQKKAPGAIRSRRVGKPPKQAAAAPTAAPEEKPKRKTLLSRVVKTAKTILKPRRSAAPRKTIEPPAILL